MLNFIKDNYIKLQRYQTSLGRDLSNGIRLDRNERVSNLSNEDLNNILNIFKNYSLSASPESDELYKSLSKYLKVEKNELFILNGITEGIRVLLDLCTHPGDNIFCLDPTYPMYEIYSKMYQLDFKKIKYNYQTLKPNINYYYENCNINTKFIFLPNPNLPIESSISQNKFLEILEFSKSRNIYVVVDEAYYYFGAPTMLQLIKEYKNLIILRTFSKAFGLAGLRIGYMISQMSNIDLISKSRSIVESNTLSMEIAKYFIENQNFKKEHIEQVKQGSIYLRTELDRIGVKYHGGILTNGLLIFLNNKKESDKIVEFMKKNKVYIRGSFEKPFDSTIRVSLGSVENMKIFSNLFEEWKNNYK